VGTFLAAYLSDRAMFWIWETPCDLMYLYEPATFDWRYPGKIPDNIELLDERHYGMHIFNLSRYEKPAYKIVSNRGLTHTALRSTLALDLLEDGFTSEIFGQILNKLIKPSKYISKSIEKILDLLHSDTDFTIGIHIRTGDLDMKINGPEGQDANNNVKSNSNKFIQCAKIVENVIIPANSRVKWFLTTDNHAERDRLSNQFPDKIITSQVYINQMQLDLIREDYKSRDTMLQEAAQGAAIDNWILGTCDYYVITESGFSISAALRNVRRKGWFYGPNGDECVSSGPAFPNLASLSRYEAGYNP